MAVLRGAKEICAYLRISTYTLYRWARFYDLPIMYTPSLKMLTSTDLIDAWIAVRANEQREIIKSTGYNRRAASRKVAAANRYAEQGAIPGGLECVPGFGAQRRIHQEVRGQEPGSVGPSSGDHDEGSGRP